MALRGTPELTVPGPPPPTGGGDMATSSVTSLSFPDPGGDFDYDCTINFGGATTVGWFRAPDPTTLDGWINHEIMVYTGGGDVTLTDILPASSNASGSWLHGAMWEPWIESGESQGFDQRYAGLSDATTQTPWDLTLNVDPGNSGSIVVPQGTNRTLVKHISRAASARFQLRARYVVIHFMSHIPDALAIPPGQSEVNDDDAPINCLVSRRGGEGPGPLWIYDPTDRPDIWLSPRLTRPSGIKSAATAIAEMPRYIGPYHNGQDERANRFRDDEFLNGSASNYSAQIIVHHAQFRLAGHWSDTTEAQRRFIEYMTLCHHRQIYAAGHKGGTGTTNVLSTNGSRGQRFSYNHTGYFAAFLLGDANIITPAPGGQMMGPTWAPPNWEGFFNNGDSRVNAQPFFPKHLNYPMSQADAVLGSAPEGLYGNIQAYGSAWEMLPVVSLRNGPGGINGVTALLGGHALNTPGQDNWRGGAVAQMDISANRVPTYFNAYNLGSEFRNAYSAILAAQPWATFNGIPEQPHDGFSFTGGDGQVAYAMDANWKHSVLPLTNFHFRYAINVNGDPPVQWVEVPNVSRSGTRTGLLRGQNHFGSMATENSAGVSEWSPTYQFDGRNYDEEQNLRGQFTTTGTATAAAPSYVGGVQPVIHYRKYPNWSYRLWEPVSGATDTSMTQFAAGVGYPSAGFPAPTYTFQWLLDGSPVSGQTSMYFRNGDIDATDLGKVLECDVTATNASGSITVRTAPITIWSEPVLPAGTLFDSDFGPAFGIIHKAEFDAAKLTVTGSSSGGNSSLQHQPFQTFAELPDVNRGSLRLYCSSAGSSAYMALMADCVDGVTYRATGVLVRERDAGSNPKVVEGTCTLTIRRPGGSTVLGTGQSFPAPQPNDQTVEYPIDFTFTAVANERPVLHINHSGSTNSIKGGHQNIHQFNVEAV